MHGATVGSRGATFSVWAPEARTLKVRVDGRDLPMTRSADGFFRAEVPGAKPGARYAYLFEDGRVRPDPASLRQPDGVHRPSALFDPSAFRWTDSGFEGRPTEELTFYELHLGTFTAEGSFDAAAAKLPELVELGITCVELMPVQPFPGTRNWGYDGVAPYAVQESYGGPEGLQRFVDRAHALGLSVCLDVVYNHMGPEGNYLRDFGPYFTSRHRSPWGDGLNFDGPDAGPVRQFMIQAAAHWIRDFHVDALRLDAVHAIQDDSPVHLVADIAAAVDEVARRQGKRVQVIAESDLNDRKLVLPRPEGWGLTAAWADDLHHALHALLTGERESFFQDFGKLEDVAKALREGFIYQGQQSAFRKKPHGTSTRGLPPTAFVGCTQNHDQVGNRPSGERLSALVPFEALGAAAATVILGPALPLLFQGEEYGETRPFLFFTSHSDPDVSRGVTEGRKKEFIAAGGRGAAPDPQDPNTYQQSMLTHRRDGRHGALYALYKTLLSLRREHLATISTRWPEVEVQGTAIRMTRPGLEVRVNLGKAAVGDLPAWGVRVNGAALWP